MGMTPEEISDRAIRAQQAWDEFFGPAIERARADYIAAITKVAADEPWKSDKIVKLSIATRVIDTVESHFRSTIAAGQVATHSINHANQIAELSPAKRKWI